MCRGDSVEFPVFINSGTLMSPQQFLLAENPKTEVYFGVMQPHEMFETAILRKQYTKDNWVLNEDGNLIIKLNPNDTICLEPGRYYYQIKVLYEDGKVESLFPKRQFIIIS